MVLCFPTPSHTFPTCLVSPLQLIPILPFTGLPILLGRSSLISLPVKANSDGPRHRHQHHHQHVCQLRLLLRRVLVLVPLGVISRMITGVPILGMELPFSKGTHSIGLTAFTSSYVMPRMDAHTGETVPALPGQGPYPIALEIR